MFFSIYSLQKNPNNNTFCVNCVNIYKLLLRGSVFRVNIYCILRQEPLQKTRCSLMRVKLSCLVLSTHWCKKYVCMCVCGGGGGGGGVGVGGGGGGDNGGKSPTFLFILFFGGRQ